MTQKSLSRLSSGSRIVATADDAAGAAVSSKLAASIHRADATTANLKNADSFLRTQDSALDAIGKGISRMMELKTLSLDATKNLSDIANYEAEFSQVRQSIITISKMKFNGIDLFSQTGQDTYLDAISDENGQQKVTITQPSLTSPVFTGLPSTASTFSFVAGNFTWTQAKADSETKGGHLATITSADKWTVLSNQVGSIILSSKNIWIGGTDSASEGNWTWITGEPWNYETWGNDPHVSPEPNGGSASNYLQLLSDQFYTDRPNGFIWNDAPNAASDADGYILEKNAPITTSTISGVSLDASLQQIATFRARTGATQAAVAASMDNSQSRSVNMEAAKSRIADVDVATETQNLSKAQILAQISSQMVKQSTDTQKVILQLIERQQSNGA